MDGAAARLHDGRQQTEGDLASLLQIHGQAEAELDEVRARLAERDTRIERLTLELRHARDIASEALVGKAKDQLAIEGKDAQLAELRRQIERHLAATATESDARLAAEMELVGAVTARDNFAAEVARLRAQLDAGLGSGTPGN
jgi:chromosome segregation ATPase